MSSYAEIYREHSHQLTCQATGVTPSLKEFQGIKAVIFDIYGTLFISGSGDIGLNAAQPREEVLRSILKEQLLFDSPTNEPLTRLLTDSIMAEHVLMRADGIDYPEIDIRDHWRDLLAPYGTFTSTQIETIAVHYEACINPVWPMPHLLETLSAIVEKGLKLGIISNAQFYTHDLFPAFFEDEAFSFTPELCLYSYQERQAKPGMHMYDKMVECLDQQEISPQEVLYIGNDMQNDIYPANQVGFHTILQAGDKRSYRPRAECNYPPPNATITSLNQILPLLG